ncbi:MAG TPA: tRNA (adenosine(37)-N6)-threonylcarbamoyltransferase complex ATPase subunit type 1 TsaE [Solirubrobacterales bacterium]|nr:tRNA (adenosine(37)-N6)-threonylcarbamoyltransferase complex ATPase subunit type 1 TsaE [Solirubrobacterales bacterium]
MSGTRGYVTEKLLRGPAGTEAAGRELASELRAGDVILLEGEVGAGKSTLVRAAMSELGVSGAIPSPTFTIGRYYDGSGQLAPISHLDLYRLGDSADEDPGLLVGFQGPDRITFIEWPGASGEELAAEATRTFRLTIEHVDESSRKVRIERPQT